MKLYHYDHCPYCVKARTIFGMKNIPFQLVPLANHDEKTPMGLVGKKMVPILTKEDGTSMGESLDIINYVDGLQSYGPPVVGPGGRSPRLDQWMLGARRLHYTLAMPRWVRVDLPEFEDPAAVTYFTNKKVKSIGDFDEAFAASAKFKTMAVEALGELEGMISDTDFLWEDFSYDDIHLFATLRVLTVVAGLDFPDKVEKYMNRLSEKFQIPLHWELSL